MHCTSMPPPRMPMVGGSSAICWLDGNVTAQLAESQISPAVGFQWLRQTWQPWRGAKSSFLHSPGPQTGPGRGGAWPGCRDRCTRAPTR